MDEILIWFDMADNFIVNETDEKIIHIHGIDNEKNSFTIILTYAASKNYYI